MTGKIFILSQPIQTGKTTLLMKWLEKQPGAGGILTPDVNGRRMLYNIAARTYQPLQLEEGSEGIRIGRFVFDPDSFISAENILTTALHNEHSWIIVDEIGRLELNRGEGLEPAMQQLISHFKTNDTGPARLLLVIRDYLLEEAIAHYHLDSATVLDRSFFEAPVIRAPAGIVLCGGKSSRMGTDKAFIIYHGEPQYLYVHDQLKGLCKEVFVSCNKEQSARITGIKMITDDPAFADAGPMTGVLSAFHKLPGTSLLIAGCDYPYLDTEHLEALLHARSDGYDAVCYVNADGFEEPLIAVYEQSCAPLLLQFYRSGQSSLRHFLRSVRIKKLVPQNREAIRSIDTPAESDL